MRPALNRRGVFGGLAACALAGGALGAPAPLPASATLLVAGPAGGRADRWADLLCPPLARALQPGAGLARQNVGGPDGVTGANQFEANAALDGSTALLVPGLAALAWLAGDARVKFDAAQWIPIWSGSVCAAVASRVRLAPGQRVRFAVGNTPGPELAAALALWLIGVELVPVQATAGSPAEVDAVFLRGEGPRPEGMPVAFGFGALSPEGEVIRDPALPDLPTAHEVITQSRPNASGRLLAGLRALSAAAQLDLALVLPQLSPAAAVAWWRHGCSALAQSGDVQAEAARIGLRPANATMAGVTTSAIIADVPVLLDVRRWLSEQWQWHPV